MKKIKLGRFSKNVATLAGGTIIAQAIPIGIMPVLSRLYSPDEFGLLAIFTSITLIFGTIACGRYELAIMLPESDEEAINIAFLGYVIAFVLALLLFLIALFLGEPISHLLKNPSIRNWLYAVPLSVFLTGIYISSKYLANRFSDYKTISISEITKGGMTTLIKMVLGFFSVVNGLIIGQTLMCLFGNSYMIKKHIIQNKLYKSVKTEKMKDLAYRYRHFPLISSWAIFVNTISMQLLNLLLPTIYSLETLGFYSFSQRILGLPTNIIGQAVGQVFFQHASEEKRKTGSANKIYRKMVLRLALFSLPAFILIFFVVEPVFAFVFGVQWRIAGTFAKILIPMYFFRFIAAPVTTTNSIFEKQYISLAWQIGLLVVTLGITFTAKWLELPIEKFLLILSVGLAMMYIALIIILDRVSKGKKLQGDKE